MLLRDPEIAAPPSLLEKIDKLNQRAVSNNEYLQNLWLLHNTVTIPLRHDNDHYQDAIAAARKADSYDYLHEQLKQKYQERVDEILDAMQQITPQSVQSLPRAAAMATIQAQFNVSLSSLARVATGWVFGWEGEPPDRHRWCCVEQGHRHDLLDKENTAATDNRGWDLRPPQTVPHYIFLQWPRAALPEFDNPQLLLGDLWYKYNLVTVPLQGDLEFYSDLEAIAAQANDQAELEKKLADNNKQRQAEIMAVLRRAGLRQRCLQPVDAATTAYGIVTSKNLDDLVRFMVGWTFTWYGRYPCDIPRTLMATRCIMPTDFAETNVQHIYMECREGEALPSRQRLVVVREVDDAAAEYIESGKPIPGDEDTYNNHDKKSPHEIAGRETSRRLCKQMNKQQRRWRPPKFKQNR